jgi:hypothetical protein
MSLTGRHRERFKTDLRSHREKFLLSDADYAERVLKVSLNTFKKCLHTNGKAPLNLKRHTLVSILANAELDPKCYGLTIRLPSQGSQYGGYQKWNYPFLCGRFFLYRRSFLTARNITRSVLEIGADELKECLSFHELHDYVSDAGTREEQQYQGDIYLNQERNILSLPAYLEGQVRLTLLHMPQKPMGREKLKMRGAVLAFGIPKGYWQPTVSCVFIEGPIDGRHPRPRDLCKTILAGTEEYAAISAELAHAEEHATIITPLVWYKAQAV